MKVAEFSVSEKIVPGWTNTAKIFQISQQTLAKIFFRKFQNPTHGLFSKFFQLEL